MALPMEQSNFRWENGVKFLERLQERRVLKDLEPDLFPVEDFQPGSTVEVCGKSGVGKSELLLNLVAKCLLPVSCCRPNDGLNCQVVYVDNDHHFSMLRLATILHSKISAGAEAPIADEFVERTCEAALKNLTIMRCTSGQQLLMSLHVLEEITIYEEPFSVLIVDSISAFYWEDRMILAQVRGGVGEHYRRMVEVIRRLTQTHRVTVFCTNQDLFHRKVLASRSTTDQVPAPFRLQSEGSWDSCSAMGTDFRALWDWRLRLTREPQSSNANAPLRNQVSVQVKRLGVIRTTSFDITECGIRFSSPNP